MNEARSMSTCGVKTMELLMVETVKDTAIVATEYE